MSKTEFNALRRRAEMARNKLKGKKNVKVEKSNSFTVYYGTDIKIKTISDKEYQDDDLYFKIKKIFEDDTIINPIGQMLDTTYYNQLNELEREKYLFDCISKYKKFKERFNREKLSSL